MSYRIYQTRGFVMGSQPLGEANKGYTLYTRDMGLIFASAQGIRLIQSKLRYSIDDFRMSSFALVRGKEIWRVTSARESEVSSLSGKQLIIFARISNLLKRLLHGEEKNEYLFDSLERAYIFLESSGISPLGRLKTFEVLVVLRCLYALGYINAEALFKEYCGTPDISESLLDSFSLHEKQALKKINRALEESHL